MMVKNESAVVERALKSALPWVDAWAVTDTGSDDNTPALVAQAMMDVPGRLNHTAWVDFATGRTEALRLAQTMGCDYILVMDADQTLVVDDRGCLADLDADGYDIEIKHGGVSYPHPWLLKSSLPWYWQGATHEHLACDVAHRAATLTGLHLIEHADSHRRATGAKVIEDRALLQAAYEDDPTNARTVFYLAQACADVGELPCALKHYRERVRMGGWIEEVWCAQYRAAHILERQGAWEYAQESYLTAFSLQNHRAEPLYRLAKGCLMRQNFSAARLFFAEAASLPTPAGALFVEVGVYDYQAAWGLSMACRLLKRHDEAEEWEKRVLAGARTPAYAVAELLNSRMTKTIGRLPG
jgi:tetratricopeptide (TPR) repeat protein